MINVARVRKAALDSDLMSAPDMMWIGASLPEITGHTASFVTTNVTFPGRFEVFLSHRGKDAKQVLVDAMLRLPSSSRIFLDCMALPTGLINRHFVFRSLIQSNEILLIETENFQHSEWCKKEAWLAGILADIKFCNVSRTVDVNDAVVNLGRFGGADAAPDPDPDIAIGQVQDEDDLSPYGVSWICSRVFKDIDYWARAPNLFSAREKGLSVTGVAQFRDGS